MQSIFPKLIPRKQRSRCKTFYYDAPVLSNLSLFGLVTSSVNPYGTQWSNCYSIGCKQLFVTESFSFTSHSALEYLSLWVDPSHSQNPSDFSSYIHQLLSPSLIHFHIGFFEYSDLVSLTPSHSSWKEIDTVLSEPKFNRLQYFVIRIRYSPYEKVFDRTDLRAIFRTMLPKSYKRGIVWVCAAMQNEWKGEYSTSVAFQKILLTDVRHGSAFHLCEEDNRVFSVVQLDQTYFRI